MSPWTIRTLLAAGCVAGCGGARTPEATPAPAANPCVVGSGVRAGNGDVLVALDQGADSTLLPVSRGAPPIRLDCGGTPRAVHASAWSADSSGRSWTLTFPDAGAVAEAWRGDPVAAETLRWGGVESLVPLDAHRLVVTFRRAFDAVPSLFADPTLGIPGEGNEPALRRMPDTGDPRDAIDRGAHLVRTSDPGALDYASTRGDLRTHPLPWDRTYVLLLFPGSSLGALDIGDSAAFRATLASDVVRTSARAAEDPWPGNSEDCRPGPGEAAPLSGPPSPVVLYPRRDPVARALAERLVAMAGAPELVARGVEPPSLAASLRQGREGGYVLALPRQSLLPCREVAGWPAGGSTIALVDTRPHLIVRDGAPPVEFDYRGALRPATGR